jgi:ubiquinone/menaquinone biosynthesis C-methylase UbiE
VNFDRIARHYQLLETIAFGYALQRARVYGIGKIPPPKRALIIGEGNGRFLCELLGIHPKIDIDCVDASARMLTLARARVLKTRPESHERVRWMHENILTWSPSGSYDLIVTHFLLDCFRPGQVKAIVDKLAQAAAPDATWLLADFNIPVEGIFARIHAKFWLRVLYWFFRGVAGINASDLVDPSQYLESNGFVCEARGPAKAAMVKSELWRRPIPLSFFPGRPR